MLFYYLKWGPPAWEDHPFEPREQQRSRTRAACLVFGAISTVESVLKTMESGKSFKLFLILDTRLSEEEEESNDDS